MPNPENKGLLKGVLEIVGVVAVIFGSATLFEGGKTLLMGPQARPPGVVFFVLVFNFTAGFFYIAAGLGVLAGKAWSLRLAQLIAAGTVMVFAALGAHIAMGGEFMGRTVAAMALRTAFWISLSLFLAKRL